MTPPTSVVKSGLMPCRVSHCLSRLVGDPGRTVSDDSLLCLPQGDATGPPLGLAAYIQERTPSGHDGADGPGHSDDGMPH
jgi:hypothetical protein